MKIYNIFGNPAGGLGRRLIFTWTEHELDLAPWFPRLPLSEQVIYYPRESALADQTCTWHVCCECVSAGRFMLAQIVSYWFSLLEIHYIHSWFGVRICSVLGVPVVERFITVTLHAKEIKKYIVKAFP